MSYAVLKVKHPQTPQRHAAFSLRLYSSSWIHILRVPKWYSRGPFRLRLTNLALFCRYCQTCDKSIACVFQHKIVKCLVEGKDRNDCRTEQSVPGSRGSIWFLGNIAEWRLTGILSIWQQERLSLMSIQTSSRSTTWGGWCGDYTWWWDLYMMMFRNLTMNIFVRFCPFAQRTILVLLEKKVPF